MTNPLDTAAAKAKAEATFKAQPIADSAATAVEAIKIAETEKTARLRALRLAKEQSDAIAASVKRARRELRRP